jgi:replicative DNA helicase
LATDPIKVPPQAIEAEMAVLGSMLIEKEAAEKAIDVLIDKDFYQDAHRKIYSAMRSLYEAGQGIDLVTTAETLRRLKQLDDVGGMEQLSSLIHKVSTAAHVEYYARIVKEKSILRELIKTATNVVTSCYGAEKEPSELLDEAQANILKVAESQKRADYHHAKDLVHEVIEQMENAHRNKEAVTGIPSGLVQLDNMTTGFQRSDLILIGARPSMGKTALALNIAANVVLSEKPRAVLFFSMEMNKTSIMQRFIASEARVNLKDTRTGFFRRERWTDLMNATARFAEAPLYIVDAPGLTALSIRSISRQVNAELKSKGSELGMVVIDYLQLIRGSGRTESRQQEVSDISRSLKMLARELNVPVMALSQLSRRVEEKGRTDAKPQLSDLRESGSLEQDADVVAFIHRESYYKRNDPTLEGKAEIIIAKQRQGPIGIAHVAFIADYTRFENETSDVEPPEMSGAQEQFA